jgi:hypothetical protein
MRSRLFLTPRQERRGRGEEWRVAALGLVMMTRDDVACERGRLVCNM